MCQLHPALRITALLRHNSNRSSVLRFAASVVTRVPTVRAVPHPKGGGHDGTWHGAVPLALNWHSHGTGTLAGSSVPAALGVQLPARCPCKCRASAASEALAPRGGDRCRDQVDRG